MRSDNFYDEDGEAMSLREVLTGILQPFGVRMVQRSGKIWLYDINGLYHGGASEQLEWALADQRLSAGRIYNKVKITLSTYDDDSSSREFEYSGEVDASRVNYDQFPNTDQYSDPGYHSFASDYNGLDKAEIDSLSFTLFNNRSADGVTLLQDGLNFYRILPIQGGSESEGVAVLFYVGRAARHTLQPDWEHDSDLVRRFGYLPGGGADGLPAGTELFSLTPMTVCLSEEAFLLRLQMSVLLDVRYNPFTELSEYNEEAASKKWYNTRRLYVPVKVELLNESGTALWHYSNRTARTSDYAFIGGQRPCTWVNGWRGLRNTMNVSWPSTRTPRTGGTAT